VALRRETAPVSVNIDIPALQSKGLSPTMSSRHHDAESGAALRHVKMGSTEFNVEMNGSPDTLAALNNIPIKTANGATIYVKDVAYVSDGFSPQVNIARMDGQRGVILAIYKTGDTSTLTSCRRSIPSCRKSETSSRHKR